MGASFAYLFVTSCWLAPCTCQAIDFNVCPEEYRKPAVSTKAATTAVAILVGAALLFPAWQVHGASQLEVTKKYEMLAPVQHDLDRATAELALQANAQSQINQTLTLVHGLEQDLDTVLSDRGDMALHLHSSLDALPPDLPFHRLAHQAVFQLGEAEGVKQGPIARNGDQSLPLETLPVKE